VIIKGNDMRKKIIAGNWKLNKNSSEAVELVESLKEHVRGVDGVELVICPVFLSLPAVAKAVAGSSIRLGAQNCYWEDSGAFTGEVSALLLKAAGVEYVIIGHSERRQYFGETDETVNKRIQSALTHGLIPIVCVGETLEERETEKTFSVIEKQVKWALVGFEGQQVENMVIAYEPVWAIGTGKTASKEQAQEVHQFIRSTLNGLYGRAVSDAVRIQYGGSVKADNIHELIAQPDIDGALVGGASLKADSFAAIVKGCVEGHR
jgi:triosephosphate isomerase (TIM)